MPGGNEKVTHIQTYLIMCDLFVTTRHYRVKMSFSKINAGQMTLPLGAKLLRRLSKKTSSRLNLIERNNI